MKKRLKSPRETTEYGAFAKNDPQQDEQFVARMPEARIITICSAFPKVSPQL